MINSKAQRITAQFGDRKYDFKSKMEYHRACVLDILKRGGEIQDWFYEPKVFRFYPPHIPKGLQGKNFGVRKYKIDFKVIEKEGGIVYEETKNNWITIKDRTKLRFMKKYYPDVRVWLVVHSIPKGNTAKSRAKLAFLKSFEPFVERIYEARHDFNRLGLK